MPLALTSGLEPNWISRESSRPFWLQSAARHGRLLM